MNIYGSKRLKVASRHSPRFPLEQKRREHDQEALVKETVLNDEVAGPEQRGVLSVGRDVCYTTIIWTQLYRESRYSGRNMPCQPSRSRCPFQCQCLQPALAAEKKYGLPVNVVHQT
jgi:hypothetical protein